jgi:hypothetical protein
MSDHEEILRIFSAEDYKAKYLHAKASGTCISCGSRIDNFLQNPYSNLEYRISALCQDCQDRFFLHESE